MFLLIQYCKPGEVAPGTGMRQTVLYCSITCHFAHSLDDLGILEDLFWTIQTAIAIFILLIPGQVNSENLFKSFN